MPSYITLGGPTSGDDEARADDGDDPTFELANVRRFIIGKESVSKFVENSRKMFLLRVICHSIQSTFVKLKECST